MAMAKTSTSITPTSTIKSKEKQKIVEIDESISKLFEIKKRLGKGAYGIVWKALDKRTSETLAVKKIYDAFRDETDAQRTFREIVFLKALKNHPNIIKLHSVYKATNNLDIYLIFEYMESDLHNIIKKGTVLKDVHKRFVMYQLLNAIKYIHSGNIIHRDLKPSNVLIDSKCRCKLADFGLARSVSNHSMRNSTQNYNNKNDDVQMEPILTDYVATRWYRAPEILIASKTYTKGIDMWSLGCILGEMIRGKPLFQGSSTINQIEKIVSTIPKITEDDINAVGADFGSVLLNKQISKEMKTPLNELLQDAPKDALDLVKSLLLLDPLRRLTAKQALCHPYVQKFRNSVTEIELNADIVPPLRDDIRLSVTEYRSKLYEIVQVAPHQHNHTLRNRPDKSNSRKYHKNKPMVKSDRILSNAKIEKDCSEVTSLNNIINKSLKNSISLVTKPNVNKSLIPAVRERYNGQDTQKALNSLHKRGKSFCQKVNNKNDKQILNLQLETIPNKAIDTQSTQSTTTGIQSRINGWNKVFKEDNINNEHVKNCHDVLKGPHGNKLCHVRTAKSDLTETLCKNISPCNITINCAASLPDGTGEQNGGKRVCYQKKLNVLEKEIARFAIDVQSFCTKNFDNTKTTAQQQNNLSNKNSPTLTNCDVCSNNSYNNIKETTNNTVVNFANIPKKSPPLQLVNKGYNHECFENKPELDLCNIHGNNNNTSEPLLLRGSTKQINKSVSQIKESIFTNNDMRKHNPKKQRKIINQISFKQCQI